MFLQRLPAVLHGRRLILLACTLACVVLALLYGLVAPKRYLATAYLVVASNGGAASVASASTQAEIATNTRVVRNAIDRLEREKMILPVSSDAELDEREKAVTRNLTVSSPRDSNVIQIGYAGSDPALAAASANAVASAYLDVVADLRTQLDNDTRAVDTGVLMTPARTPRDPISPGMAKILPLAAFLGLLVGACAVLAWEQFRLRVRRPDDLVLHTGSEVLATVPLTRFVARVEAEGATLIRVVQDRTFSPVSAAARPLGNLLVAFGAMSLFDAEAVVTAQRRSGGSFGENALSMGLISDHQLKRALSVQYGRPRVTASSQEPSASLVVDQEPDHPVAEAVRGLRSQLLLRPVGERPGTMTITSVDAHDGRTFVATNLALAFSQIGKRVLLIDANLRSPSMHALFNVPNERGLSGYLARRHGAPRIHDVGTRGNLGVMLAGPIPPNPQELLSSPLLGTLLRSLRSVYELIVIDTPASTIGADAQLLSARAGSTIIVSRLHVTALDDVGRLAKNLGRQGVKVLGTIVNEA